MNDKQEGLAVLVTGIGGGGHGAQILKALKAGSLSYTIIGTDMSRYSTGLTLVDHPYIVPPASDEGYLDAILDLCSRHEIRAVFHGSEQELKVFSENRAAFAERDIFLPINPRTVIERCMDKVATAEFLRDNDFAYPAFAKVESADAAAAFPHLPAVLKPAVGGGGSADTFLVQDREMLAVCVRQLLSISDYCIIQEYVGRPEDEFTVGVLCDMDGELLNSIAVRRHIMSALSNRIKVPNRTDRTDLGPTLAISSGVSQGDIGRFPEVTEQCEQIALALGARGAINLQCRLVAGRVYVFEINPRFSGTTSLRAMVGYNEPEVLIRKHVLGHHIEPHFSYRSGCILRDLRETFIENPGI